MNIPKEFEKYAKFGMAMGIATQLYDTRITTLLDRFGLTVPQFSLLNHLARIGTQGQGITAIAAAVEVKQPAVSKIVNKFEISGWVAFKTTTHDARAKKVILTPQGADHLRSIQRNMLPEFINILDGWSEDDISTLTSLLFRLNGALDAKRDG